MLAVQSLENKSQEITSSYNQSLKKRLWNPSTYQNFVATQQPVYTDKKILEDCLSQLKKAPALVHQSEIEQLKKHIASAGRGNEFLMQAGDCAEQFKDCHPEIVTNKIKALLQIKDTLEKRLKKIVTPIGRLAGQYAKPRSNETETQDQLTLPSFKGDIIHSSEFTLEARKTNPLYMLEAYHKSAETLNYIRLHQGCEQLFYTSHEALLLCYESALTRAVGNDYYNTSAHMLWLGERTRELTGAHVEYLRGVKNPIGIKLSHKVTNKELVELVLALNPNQEEGKIVLIPRLGCDYVDQHLPRFIQAAKGANLIVTWMCDPMHGNGEVSINGIKTRRFENISAELIRTIEIHKIYGTVLGGIHLETSADDVTECLGGKQQIQPHDLEKNYQSACDPRLNFSQSIELAGCLGEGVFCE